MGGIFSGPGVAEGASVLAWGGFTGLFSGNSMRRYNDGAGVLVAVAAVQGRIEVTAPGTIRNLRVTRAITPVAGNIRFDVLVNGLVAFGVNLIDPNTSAQNTASSFSVIPGDFLEIQVTIVVAPATDEHTIVSLEFFG